MTTLFPQFLMLKHWGTTKQFPLGGRDNKPSLHSSIPKYIFTHLTSTGDDCTKVGCFIRRAFACPLSLLNRDQHDCAPRVHASCFAWLLPSQPPGPTSRHQ